MGIKIYGDVVMHGNFAKITKKKPKGMDKEYKVMIPFPFKWRTKIGEVECDCVECLECFMPYYGWDWFHSPQCALMRLVEKKPQLMNLPAYQQLPLIASHG